MHTGRQPFPERAVAACRTFGFLPFRASPRLSPAASTAPMAFRASAVNRCRDSSCAGVPVRADLIFVSLDTVAMAVL
jgi:hypothetical protein